MEDAIELHRKKQILEAEKAYRFLLGSGAPPAEAYNNLASILIEREQYRPAILLLLRALKARPTYADALSNLSACHGYLADWPTSVQYAHEAKKLDPGNPMPHLWLLRAQKANHTRQNDQSFDQLSSRSALEPWDVIAREEILDAVSRGQHSKAARITRLSLAKRPNSYQLFTAAREVIKHHGKLSLLAKILQKSPPRSDLYPNASHLFAIALISTGREQDAILRLMNIVKAHPSHAHSWAELGQILVRQHNYPKAIGCLARASKEDPASKEFLLQLADAQNKGKEFSSSVATTARARRLYPEDAEVLCAHSNALIDANRADEAISIITRFLKLRKKLPSAQLLNSLSLGYIQKKQRHKAIALLNRATKLDPGNPGILNNLGLCHGLNGNEEEEVTCYKKAIDCDPNDPGSHVNLGMALMARQDFERGLVEYEWRLQAEKSPLNMVIEGRIAKAGERPPTLTVVSEQGLGDTIHFCRYIFDLAKCLPDTHIRFACPGRLHGIFKATLGNMVDLLPTENPDKLGSGDQVFLPLMSVPLFCGIHPFKSCAPQNYVKISSDEVKKAKCLIRHRVPDDQKVIAINWRGNPESERTNLSGRSMNLEDMRYLIEQIPNARFVSLQKGTEAEDELKSSPAKSLFIPNQYLVTPEWSFTTTAAICLASDYVISTDTCMAHLASAVGARSHLLITYRPEWRWRGEGGQTPWYPLTQIHRQTKDGSWIEPKDNLAKYLQSTPCLHLPKPSRCH